jgi:hypothetical protein
LTLRTVALAGTLQPIQVGAETESAIADLECRVAKMRALGVTRWGDIELGPVPLSDAASDDRDQRTLTADELTRRAREERRRVAMASSGGPVPRVARQ